jgi:hypothetical protein
MEAEVKAHLAAICDKLTSEQLDDAESRYDNLEVLLAKIFDEYDVGNEHVPGLDEHMHELTHEAVADIHRAAILGQSTTLALRYALVEIFWFGYEAGKMNYPLPRMKCEEAHG